MRDIRIDNCISDGGDPYQNLANAIIVQAVKDYMNGYQRDGVIKFFKSDWYKCLTSYPSDDIIKIANKLCEKEPSL